MSRDNLARKPIPSPEAPPTGADIKAKEALTAEAAPETPKKSPQEILAQLKAVEAKHQRRQMEKNLHNIAEVVDIFEVCESLNPNFSPDFLTSAARDVARAEKAQKEGGREQAIKKAEEKYALPEGLLQKFMALTEKIGTGSIMTMLKRFETDIKKLKQGGEINDSLEAAMVKVAKWSQLDKWGGRSPAQEKMDAQKAKQEAADKAGQELIDSVLNGKLTPDAVLDLTVQQKKMLLDHASELAAQPGVAGADFYQKLDKLGITPKTARVSNVQARFRDRASSMESTGVGVTSGKPPTESRSSLINPLEKPKAMVTTAPVEAERPAKQEGALRNFWRALTGKYEEGEPTAKKTGFFARLTEAFRGKGSKQEQSQDRLQAKVAREQKAYYAPLLRELKRSGRDLSEASNLANLNSTEYNLLENLLTGKIGQISTEDRKTFQESMKKVLTAADADPENKSLDILTDIYIEVAKQIGETGPTSAYASSKLAGSRARRLGGMKRGKEMSSVGGIFSGTPDT